MNTGNVRFMNQISGVITGDDSFSGPLAKCIVSLERSIRGSFSFPADISLPLLSAAFVDRTGVVLCAGDLPEGKVLLGILPSELKRIVGREMHYLRELANGTDLFMFVAIQPARKQFPVNFSLLQQSRLILSPSTGEGDPINCHHGRQAAPTKNPVARVIPIITKDNSHPNQFSCRRKYHQLALAPEEDTAFCIETNPAYQFAHGLTDSEKRLLQVLSFYRRAVPQTHRILLEQHLSVPGAWAGLVCQGLIVADSTPWHVRLSEHLSGWLRSRSSQDSPEDTSTVATRDSSSDQIMPKRAFHAAISSCWLDELLDGQSALTRQRLQAREALFHLTEAGDSIRIRQIPLHLFSGDLSWARQRLRKLYDDLYRQNAPLVQQRQVLECRAELDPDNHVVQRFLGQCWQKENGKGSSRAIACFELACRLRPNYPPYWADLGNALLSTGRKGAQEFIHRLEILEQECPAAINDHVLMVKIACLKAAESSENAGDYRQKMIRSGSTNAVFYAEEAKTSLKSGRFDQVLTIIALAEQRGCANDFIVAIKATALQKSGRNSEAAAIRRERITAGSSNPAFYNDEATARLRDGDPAGALNVLNIASVHCVANDHLIAITATALDRTGRHAEATRLRMAKIEEGSKDVVFYNDAAKALLAAGNCQEARNVLALAVKNNCANQGTSVLWARCERMAG